MKPISQSGKSFPKWGCDRAGQKRCDGMTPVGPRRDLSIALDENMTEARGRFVRVIFQVAVPVLQLRPVPGVGPCQQALSSHLRRAEDIVDFMWLFSIYFLLVAFFAISVNTDDMKATIWARTIAPNEWPGGTAANGGKHRQWSGGRTGQSRPGTWLPPGG